MRARRQIRPDPELEPDHLLGEPAEASAGRDGDRLGAVVDAIRDLSGRLRNDMRAAREAGDFEGEERSYDSLVALLSGGGGLAEARDLVALPREWTEGLEWTSTSDQPGDDEERPFAQLRRAHGRVFYARELARKLARIERNALREILSLLSPESYNRLDRSLLAEHLDGSGLPRAFVMVLLTAVEEEALRLRSPSDEERDADGEEERKRLRSARWKRARSLLAAVRAIDTAQAVRADLGEGRFIRALAFALDEIERRPLQMVLLGRRQAMGGRGSGRRKSLEKAEAEARIIALADDASTAYHDKARHLRVRYAMRDLGHLHADGRPTDACKKLRLGRPTTISRKYPERGRRQPKAPRVPTST